MLDKVQIIYKSVRHANLKVKPTLEVILTVPKRMSRAEINDILIKRQGWISEKLEYFKKKSLAPKQFINGEKFEYLNQTYQLEIINSKIEYVKLSGHKMQLYTSNLSSIQHKSQLINKWYREKAQEYFLPVINKYLKIVNRNVKSVSIKPMTTRWGSCNSAKGYINLNLELIKKHPDAIEYVIFHELVHLIYVNHDKKFYNYLTSFMPDWKEKKQLLDNK